MSKLNTIFTNCPVIKSDIQSLAQRITVGGERLMMVPFEKKIYWTQESESEIQFYHGEKLFQKGSTYTDHYGFLKSAASAIDEAKELLKVYSITPESSLSVLVKTKIYHVPLLKEPGMDSGFDAEKTFVKIPEDAFWFEQSPLLAEYEKTMNAKESTFEDKFSAYDKIEHLRIETRIVEKDLIIWSNTHDTLKMLEALKRKYI